MTTQSTTHSDPVHLSPAELVDRWRGQIAEHTLANWRSEGRGPDYMRIGGRVLYPMAAVEAWEESNKKGG